MLISSTYSLLGSILSLMPLRRWQLWPEALCFQDNSRAPWGSFFHFGINSHLKWMLAWLDFRAQRSGSWGNFFKVENNSKERQIPTSNTNTLSWWFNPTPVVAIVHSHYQSSSKWKWNSPQLAPSIRLERPGNDRLINCLFKELLITSLLMLWACMIMSAEGQQNSSVAGWEKQGNRALSRKMLKAKKGWWQFSVVLNTMSSNFTHA